MRLAAPTFFPWTTPKNDASMINPYRVDAEIFESVHIPAPLNARPRVDERRRPIRLSFPHGRSGSTSTTTSSMMTMTTTAPSISMNNNNNDVASLSDSSSMTLSVQPTIDNDKFMMYAPWVRDGPKLGSSPLTVETKSEAPTSRVVEQRQQERSPRLRPLARTIFFLGFLFPLIWSVGAILLWRNVDPAYEVENGLSAEEGSIAALQAAEERWSWRCIWAFVLSMVALSITLIVLYVTHVI